MDEELENHLYAIWSGDLDSGEYEWRVRQIKALIDSYTEKEVEKAKAGLAKSILLGGGDLPAHTKEHLQGIVDKRIKNLSEVDDE
jgi:hypothetical protein